ncbi:hypothetical protein [Ruegeria sp. HKCCD8929]|uniref:hypothetical protein n=1 Tax=Ruegeria sp. HKCCD8929 TaxID=2683006 RepID=UPI001489926E|nr:hypothetical protein [Ruegeria sp. HKCCD8929]
MISDTARYHGSFFTLLFDEVDQPLIVERLSEYGVGCYLLAERIPVYLKHSTKRKGPWAFNFFRSHQVAQQTLFEKYGECFTCMICGQDGIAGLSMAEFRQVLDGNFEEQECVSVRRRLKTMYHIKGRDGELENRVARRSVFEKLTATIMSAGQL